MLRFVSASLAVRSVVFFALFALALGPATGGAATSNQLQRVRGTIGWSTNEGTTDFTQVFGKFDLPGDDYAVTRGQSAAVVALPDSSLISLGENANVQIGALDAAAAQPGSVIQVKNGALRFDIRRPQGGAANYRFVTNTSTVGVRGTVGLLAVVNGVTTVGCLACQADSVTVTVGSQTVTLVTGQFVTISVTGVITTGAISTITGTFAASGVPVTAQSTAVAAGLPATTGIAGGAVGVGAAAAVGTAIGVSSATAPQGVDTAPVNANNTGSGNGTQSGNISVNRQIRVPQTAPTPAPRGPGR